jgi:hypothetical protein
MLVYSRHTATLCTNVIKTFDLMLDKALKPIDGVLVAVRGKSLASTRCLMHNFSTILIRKTPLPVFEVTNPSQL